MQESGAKRPAKLLQRNSTEENDRADTLSGACQVGDADGDVPAHPSKTTELAQTPESSQETPINTLRCFYWPIHIGVFAPCTCNGL